MRPFAFASFLYLTTGFLKQFGFCAFIKMGGVFSSCVALLPSVLAFFFFIQVVRANLLKSTLCSLGRPTLADALGGSTIFSFGKQHLPMLLVGMCSAWNSGDDQACIK